jgi:ATP-dependent RNA helicase HelY
MANRPGHSVRRNRSKFKRNRTQDPTSATSKPNPEAPKIRASTPDQIKELLKGIGTPEPRPFQPDPFQLEALERIDFEDVLVTAPTGSGKTWIAREKIRSLIESGRRAWYASPLKALTNSKYQEFTDEFGKENVGILTGDRKENPDAPLIVGTTEIYRNQLFDALRGGSELETDLVVLDEAHYLADEDRGHVWEEAIILTPHRVRMLLLSATVGNASELSNWMKEVRGVDCTVVSRPGARPVPLRAAFLLPAGEIAPLFSNGRFNPKIAEILQSNRNQSSRARESGRMGMPEMPPAALLNVLRSYDLLPAIVFLPTRRRCDEAASEAAIGKLRESQERKEARRKLLRELVEEHKEVRNHRHIDIVARSGVASHHAGHIPAWKLIVEKLMSQGLLDAIFATATVAAGVDFPARTVVFTGLEARTGNGWRQLSASEFQQMTGRAGRRGRDHVGFVVVAPGTHQNPQRAATLLSSPADTLESQFKATYTNLLNLLDAYGNFKNVREIAERSFAHKNSSHKIAHLEKQRSERELRISTKLRPAGQGVTVETLLGFERLAAARARLMENLSFGKTTMILQWLDEVVVPGRVVRVGRSGKKIVFVTERRGANVIGVRDDGRRTSFSIDRVNKVYAKIFPLSEKEAQNAFAEAMNRQSKMLEEPRMRDLKEQNDEAVELINRLMDEIILEAAKESDKESCELAFWSAIEDGESVERINKQLEVLHSEIWSPFQKRARILEKYGYLEMSEEKVTENGRWLADLRLDRPLLVGEAISRGLFKKAGPDYAAGLMAAAIADPDRDFGFVEMDDKLVELLTEFEALAYEVATEEWNQGLENSEEINFAAAAAACSWAKGELWENLVVETRTEEGDLVRMLSRTGESLLQIGVLRSSHPEEAAIARKSADSLLRYPVRVDE